MANKRTNTASWQQAKKCWRIVVTRDGIRKEFTSFVPGKKGQLEANAKADTWLTGEVTESLTTQEAFHRFIEDKKTYTGKGNWRVAVSHFDNWFSPIAKKKLDKLTPYDFQRIINTAYSHGLSKKTLQNIRGTATQFLKFCRLNHYTDLRIDDISIPSNARIGVKHILQPEHLRILFSSDQTFLNGVVKFDSYIYAYRFQVLTGLRPGELVALRWKDVDDFVVHVRGSINRYGERTNGKNANAIRDFYLNDMTRQLLKQQKDLKKPGESVFGIHCSQTYRKRFIAYCNYNEIPHTTPYELRHTFVSVAKNLSEGQLKQIVGHSKSMDTYGVYSHTVEGDLQNTSTQLNSIFQSFIFPEKQAN